MPIGGGALAVGNLPPPAVSRQTLPVERLTSDTRCCTACGRPSPSIRKGRCSRCYQAARNGTEPGPACEVCSLADPRVLVRRRMPVDGCDTLAWRTLCANCDAVGGKRPLTLVQLAAEVRPTGDRRRAGDRRRGERRSVDGDRRITAGRTGEGDRRTGDRRATAGGR